MRWHVFISHLLVFCRCPDASIQPVVCGLRRGTGSGGVLICLLIAQSGVSSLCWPRLGLPLWSPRLWGLQGETNITHINYAAKQAILSSDYTLGVGEAWSEDKWMSRWLLLMDIQLLKDIIVRNLKLSHIPLPSLVSHPTLCFSLPLSIFLSISISQFLPKSHSSTDKPRITNTLLTTR